MDTRMSWKCAWRSSCSIQFLVLCRTHFMCVCRGENEIRFSSCVRWHFITPRSLRSRPPRYDTVVATNHLCFAWWTHTNICVERGYSFCVCVCMCRKRYENNTRDALRCVCVCVGKFRCVQSFFRGFILRLSLSLPLSPSSLPFL